GGGVSQTVAARAGPCGQDSSARWVRHATDSTTAPRSAIEPGVPEVHARRRAELAAELTSGGVEREVVAPLHVTDVVIDDGLQALDDGLALLRIALGSQVGDQPLLV